MTSPVLKLGIQVYKICSDVNLFENAASKGAGVFMRRNQNRFLLTRLQKIRWNHTAISANSAKIGYGILCCYLVFVLHALHHRAAGREQQNI